MTRLLSLLLCALLALIASPAAAQTFPALTGRVVDDAHLLSADQAAALTARLKGLEDQSGRQLVVVTLPDLQGYDIADYGYQLGRKWGIGAKGRNDGALLIIAPTERKVRIEAGYGLEGVITDALSSVIIQRDIVPRFKAGDYPGGIAAGTESLIRQLQLPADQAKQVAANAAAQRTAAAQPHFDIGTVVFLLIFFFFFLLPLLRSLRGGGRRFGGPGVIVFPGGGWGGGGWGGGGWGGGSSGGSDWGGGFSGGGGDFGGGGASGSW